MINHKVPIRPRQY